MEDWPEDMKRVIDELIRIGEGHGFVTHTQVNEVLPSREYSTQEIEALLAALNENGIHIVEG
jgi:RNA polymerase primary sigma factor